ncbi:hypothetical protein CS8_041610 [Cupriavidus sp. 8B]
MVAGGILARDGVGANPIVLFPALARVKGRYPQQPGAVILVRSHFVSTASAFEFILVLIAGCS